jgi:toxin FitB
MIYLLDTNVVSELMRPEPAPSVLAWIAAKPLDDLAITAITLMEIRYGIASLPAGRRRDHLDGRFRAFVAQGFGGSALPFDAAAGEACAIIRATRKQNGLPLAIEDAMIAAIARSAGRIVVTRDTGGFDGCGVEVVNPWE